MKDVVPFAIVGCEHLADVLRSASDVEVEDYDSVHGNQGVYPNATG
jgi:hypothetical protein